jgi:diguanylate cyclase (GGDEF)-like protein
VYGNLMVDLLPTNAKLRRRALQLTVRASDLTARVGGEEFMVAFPGLDLATALDACERLRTTIGRTNWEALAPGLKVTVSVGLACGPEATPDALVQRADRALYRAKQEGRDRLVVLR